MTLRRYSALKPSRGTVWPPEVRAEVERLDGGRCVCERAGFPTEVVAACTGDLQLDHVRASHGIGMKSRSTVDNAVLLSATAHRWKTNHGREARPLLLDWIDRRTGGCVHVDPVFGCVSCARRSDPLTLREVGL